MMKTNTIRHTSTIQHPFKADRYTTHPDHSALIRLLDAAPLRLPHFMAWALSSGGTLLDGLSVFMLGIAIPSLIHDMNFSVLEIALLGSALVSGAVFGASAGGRLADHIGRKPVFILDMALLSVSAGIAAFSWSPIIMIGAQMLTGFCIGMDFPVSSSYVAETMPHHYRSPMMVATIACQSVGMLFAAIIVLILVHLSGSEPVWRLLFASESLLAVIFLLARLNLSESPRWLMGLGRNHEAVLALEKLLHEDHRVLDTRASRLGHEIHHVAKVSRKTISNKFSVLFHPAYRRRTFLSTLPWFLMDIATYGVGLFTAVLLGSLHFISQAANTEQKTGALAAGSGIIDISLLIGFLIGIWAVAKFGRIRMQLTGFAGMAAGMLILFSSIVIPSGPNEHLLLILTGFALFNLSMNMGPNCTTYILPAELFPTQVRATAVGFAAACAKIGATTGVFVLPIIKAKFGIPAVLILMTIVSLLGLLFTWIFRVEGHHRTLEEHHRTDLP